MAESAARPAGFAVAVNLVMFSVVRRQGSSTAALSVLLKRARAGAWALPGGALGPSESLDDGAHRRLRDETPVRDVYLEQLYTFGDPKRGPGSRELAVAYFALIADGKAEAPSDPRETTWHPVTDLPRLILDHREMIDYATLRLKNKLEYTTVGFQLLPAAFTLSHLQQVYELILEKRLDKRNFRRKMLSLGILRKLPRTVQEGAGRPAHLYSFREADFVNLKDRGIIFPF